MKKIIVALSFVAASSLFANNDTNRVEVDITAGVNKFDSSSRLSNNASLYGIRGTIYESEVDKYGFQLAYEGATGVDYERLRTVDKVKDTGFHRIYANVIVDGEKDYGILPYLVAGLGYEYLSDEIKGEISQGIGNLGVGFKYGLDYGLNVALEVRGIGKFDSGDIDYITNLVFGYTLNQTYTNENSYLKQATQQVPQVLEEKTTNNAQTIINEITITNDDLSSVSETPIVEEEIVKKQSNQFGEITSDVNELSYTNEYFVELAAYKTTPTQPLVDKLANAGYINSVVYPELTSRGDEINLVLVGPYDTKREAKRELSKLKKISHDAFVMKMK